MEKYVLLLLHNGSDSSMILLASTLLECDRSLSQLFHNFFWLLLINIQNKPHFLKGTLADPSMTEKDILQFRYCTTLFNTTYNFNSAKIFTPLYQFHPGSQVPLKVDFLSLSLLNCRWRKNTCQDKSWKIIHLLLSQAKQTWRNRPNPLPRKSE